MNCTIQPLCLIDDDDAAFIYDHACKKGSDFSRKIASGALTPSDGVIAIVADQGEIIGWARTEHWTDADGREWPTLEAFTRPEYRRRGVCRYAVAGLVADRWVDRAVAVFDPRMADLCRHLRIDCCEFHLENGVWVRKR